LLKRVTEHCIYGFVAAFGAYFIEPIFRIPNSRILILRVISAGPSLFWDDGI
jgi:hypothetical protein